MDLGVAVLVGGLPNIGLPLEARIDAPLRNSCALRTTRPAPDSKATPWSRTFFGPRRLLRALVEVSDTGADLRDRTAGDARQVEVVRFAGDSIRCVGIACE